MTPLACMWCHKDAGVSAEDALRVDTKGDYPLNKFPEGWIVETSPLYPEYDIRINRGPIGVSYSIFCSKEHRDLWHAEHDDFNDVAKHTGLV